MFKTILVPTDSSSHADKAVEIAADLARQYGSELLLAHVLQEGRVPEALREMIRVEHLSETTSAAQPFAGSIPAEIATLLDAGKEGQGMRRAYEALGNRILDHAEGAARDKGVARVRKVLETGDPAHRILELAEREGVDLIVMGSRGLGEIKGLLMGSVSHKVGQLARCTCVTVK